MPVRTQEAPLSDKKLPDQLNTAAIIQIVSGVLNIFFMGAAVYFGVAVAGSLVWMCTMGLCPVFLCGVVGFLLIPVGILEVLSGVLILTNNPSALKVQRIVSIIQKVSILVGGIGSIIASFVVDGMINDPEVLAYLESVD